MSWLGQQGLVSGAAEQTARCNLDFCNSALKVAFSVPFKDLCFCFGETRPACVDTSAGVHLGNQPESQTWLRRSACFPGQKRAS